MKKINKIVLSVAGLAVLGAGTAMPFALKANERYDKLTQEADLNQTSDEYQPNVYVDEIITITDTFNADDNGRNLGAEEHDPLSTIATKNFSFETDFIENPELELSEITGNLKKFKGHYGGPDYNGGWNRKNEVHNDGVLGFTKANKGQWKNTGTGNKLDIDSKFSDWEFVDTTKDNSTLNVNFTFETIRNNRNGFWNSGNRDETDGLIASVDSAKIKATGLVDEFDLSLMDTHTWGTELEQKLGMPIFAEQMNLVTYYDLEDALFEVLPEFGGIPTSFTEITFEGVSYKQETIDAGDPIKFKIQPNGEDGRVYGSTDWIQFDLPLIHGEFIVEDDNNYYQEEHSEWEWNNDQEIWELKTNTPSSLKVIDPNITMIKVNGQDVSGGVDGVYDLIEFGKEVIVEGEPNVDKVDITFANGETQKFNIRTQLRPVGIKFTDDFLNFEPIERTLSTMNVRGNEEVVNGFINENRVEVDLETNKLESGVVDTVHINKYNEDTGAFDIDYAILDKDNAGITIEDSGLYLLTTKDEYGNSYEELLEIKPNTKTQGHLSAIDQEEDWGEIISQSEQKGFTESDLLEMDNIEFQKHFEYINSLQEITETEIAITEVEEYIASTGVRVLEGVTTAGELENRIREFVFQKTGLDSEDLNISIVNPDELAEVGTTVHVSATQDGKALGEFSFEMRADANVFDVSNRDIDLQEIRNYLTSNDVRILEGVTEVEEIKEYIKDSVAEQLNTSSDDLLIEVEDGLLVEETSQIRIIALDTNSNFHGEKVFDFQMDSNISDLANFEISNSEFNHFLLNNNVEIVEDVTTLEEIEEFIYKFVEEKTNRNRSNFIAEFDGSLKASDEFDIKVIGKQNSLLFGELEFSSKVTPNITWENTTFRDKEVKSISYSKGDILIQEIEYLNSRKNQNGILGGKSGKADAMIISNAEFEITLDGLEMEVSIVDKENENLYYKNIGEGTILGASSDGNYVYYDESNNYIIDQGNIFDPETNNNSSKLIGILILAIGSVLGLILIREVLTYLHSRNKTKLI